PRDLKLTPKSFIAIFQLIDQGLISGKIAKGLLPQMLDTKKEAGEIIKQKGLAQISDSNELNQIVQAVIAENPKPVSDFLKGKLQAATFLVGQVMKKSRGQANPGAVNEILKEKLRKEH
ncbi:MAG: Asp-tRNA(Asn)/Glu-tRNA(Gln) amidotransferase GatCAB subunit B, partial [Candidatus Omnitrophica bacterium]|nr:Asp-tRNA(Asn)/Glu-tRNA(Gln) amidotransferase GatCAB subunit B [Candidatus Omnitrophota bacterium]